MSKPLSTSWPDDRVLWATSLWKQGWSAGQIGRELGVSRSAVIGKLHRMGLNRLSRDPDVPQAAPKSQTHNIKMLEVRDGQCRWPMWPHGSGWPDFLMCGLPCLPASAYCAAHARIAFAKPGKAHVEAEMAA